LKRRKSRVGGQLFEAVAAAAEWMVVCFTRGSGKPTYAIDCKLISLFRLNVDDRKKCSPCLVAEEEEGFWFSM
jgi:hypothetical protein